MTASTEVEAVTEPAPKKISQREQAALTRLVKSRYETAQETLNSTRDKYIAERTREIKDKYASIKDRAKSSDLLAEARGVQDEVDALLSAFSERLTAEGLGFVQESYGSRRVVDSVRVHIPTVFAPVGMDNEIRVMVEQARAASQEAYYALARNKNTAEEAILTAVITSTSALDILDSLPSPESAFVDALPAAKAAAALEEAGENDD